LPADPPTDSAAVLFDVLFEFVGKWSADEALQAVARNAGLDLDAAQFLAIMEIGRSADGVLAGDLAAPLHMSASNVSKVLARLERKKLIERSASSRDRRAVRVTPTAEGRRVADALRASGVELVSALTTRWPRRDTERLVALLKRLMHDAGTQQADAAAGSG
jgi:DNA-binding MarR family transcriptional regulator